MISSSTESMYGKFDKHNMNIVCNSYTSYTCQYLENVLHKVCSYVNSHLRCLGLHAVPFWFIFSCSKNHSKIPLTFYNNTNNDALPNNKQHNDP
jgi:hypothetical protein